MTHLTPGDVRGLTGPHRIAHVPRPGHHWIFRNIAECRLGPVEHAAHQRGEDGVDRGVVLTGQGGRDVTNRRSGKGGADDGQHPVVVGAHVAEGHPEPVNKIERLR